jgi:hypothetical protein
MGIRNHSLLVTHTNSFILALFVPSWTLSRASQPCRMASFYEGNLHSTQLATGSLKHETGGKTFPPSHRFNSFLHNRNSYRTSSILLQTTNHFVTVAPSPSSFLPFVSLLPILRIPIRCCNQRRNKFFRKENRSFSLDHESLMVCIRRYYITLRYFWHH